ALVFFFSSRRRHTRFSRDWSSDVCSSDLKGDENRTVDRVVRECVSGRLQWGGKRMQRTPSRPTSSAAGKTSRRPQDSGRERSDRSEERRVGKEWRERGEEAQEEGDRVRSS